MNQVIQNVSDAAFMVAGFRALESERPEPLFRDPLAWTLAGQHGRKILATVPKTFVGGWSVVIRTVIIDDFIKEAIEQGADTILNLGAGLDTRPYRMELPKTLRWVEVDFPHVIALKESRLADERPNCRLDRIELDLTDRALRQRLLAEVSESAEKILVLTEGVVPYLSNSEVSDLAGDLRAVEKVRFWIVDYFLAASAALWAQASHPLHAQCAVPVRANELVRLLRQAGLARLGGPLHRRGSRAAWPADSASLAPETLADVRQSSRLTRPP